MKFRRVPPLVAGIGLAATAASSEEWAFAVEPYVWAPAVDVGLGIGPNPPVGSSTSIFDVLDGAVLVAGEARRGPLSVFGEVNWLKLSDTIETPFGTLDTEWRVNGVMASVKLGCAPVDGPALRLEPFVGVRGWTLDARTCVRGRTAERERRWIDPLLGVRAEAPLTERVLSRGAANVGGFGVGSDLQWEVLAGVERQATEWLGLGVGDRQRSVDFDDDGLIWDTTLSGPVVSARLSF